MTYRACESCSHCRGFVLKVFQVVVHVVFTKLSLVVTFRVVVVIAGVIRVFMVPRETRQDGRSGKVRMAVRLVGVILSDLILRWCTITTESSAFRASAASCQSWDSCGGLVSTLLLASRGILGLSLTRVVGPGTLPMLCLQPD